MCDSVSDLPPLEEDEYLLDTPRVRELVADVRTTIAAAGSPLEAVEALEPLFTELLADEGDCLGLYDRKFGRHRCQPPETPERVFHVIQDA